MTSSSPLSSPSEVFETPPEAAISCATLNTPEQDMECKICFERLGDAPSRYPHARRIVLQTTCGCTRENSVFHEACLANWMSCAPRQISTHHHVVQIPCPLARHPVNIGVLQNIYNITVAHQDRSSLADMPSDLDHDPNHPKKNKKLLPSSETKSVLADNGLADHWEKEAILRRVHSEFGEPKETDYRYRRWKQEIIQELDHREEKTSRQSPQSMLLDPSLFSDSSSPHRTSTVPEMPCETVESSPSCSSGSLDAQPPTPDRLSPNRALE